MSELAPCFVVLDGGYGTAHRALRKRWAVQVAAGGVLCARCNRPIAPGQPWDLGHDDLDRTEWTGPEHAHCNRGAPRRQRPEIPPVTKTSRKW